MQTKAFCSDNMAYFLTVKVSIMQVQVVTWLQNKSRAEKRFFATLTRKVASTNCREKRHLLFFYYLLYLIFSIVENIFSEGIKVVYCS